MALPIEVATNTVDESDGAIAIVPIYADVNPKTGAHAAPPDIVLNSPFGVPAYATFGATGSTASAVTPYSTSRPVPLAATHGAPPVLVNTPFTVAAYTVSPLAARTCTGPARPVSIQLSPPFTLFSTCA